MEMGISWAQTYNIIRAVVSRLDCCLIGDRYNRLRCIITNGDSVGYSWKKRFAAKVCSL